MVFMWQELDLIRSWLPKLQGHRGYWVEGLPQNTLASIKESCMKNYEITELDVRLTSDNEVILFHDAELENIRVSDLRLSEIKKIRAVDTLRDVFMWLSEVKNFKLNIEIKNDGILNYMIERSVCDLVSEFKLQNRVMISSFNPLSLAKIRLFNSDIPRALLLTYENEPGNNLAVKSGLMNSLAAPNMLNLRCEDYMKYREHFKKLAQKIPIVLWTVNNIEIYREYKNEIHGVISDEITPEMLQL